MSEAIDLARFHADVQPAPAELADAPVLDRWKPLMRAGDVALEGLVTGHPRLPGGEIVTSPLVQLDRDLTWARTVSRYYRLGNPAGHGDGAGPSAPLVVRMACSGDWQAAAALVIAHTRSSSGVDERTVARTGELHGDVSGISWAARRDCVGKIVDELTEAGKTELADCWSILLADPSEPLSCLRPEEVLDDAATAWFDVRGYDDDHRARRVKAMLRGWFRLTAGEDAENCDPDPIRAASGLRGTPVFKDPRAGLPPVLEMAHAADWMAALSFAVSGSELHRDSVGAALMQRIIDFASAAPGLPWGIRRADAARIGEAVSKVGGGPIAAAWMLLAACTTEPESCKFPADVLAVTLDVWVRNRGNADDGLARDLAIAIAGWKALAAGDGVVTFDPDPDPIRAAHRIGERLHSAQAPKAAASGLSSLADYATLFRLRAGVGGLAYDIAITPDLDQARDLLLRSTRAVLGSVGGGGEIRQRAEDWRRSVWDGKTAETTSSARRIRDAIRDLAQIQLDGMTAQRLQGLAGGWSVMAAADYHIESCMEAALAIYRAAIERERELAGGRFVFRAAAERIMAGWAFVACGLRPLSPFGEAENVMTLARNVGEIVARDMGFANAASGSKSLIEELRVGESESELPPEEPGLVVLKEIGGTSHTTTGREAAAEFESIAGKRLRLVETPDLAAARKTLVQEFPHCADAIDAMLSDCVGRRTIKLSNWLLSGDSGSGKSRLSRRLPEILGLPVTRYDGAGSSDSAFGGTPRRWSSGEPCVPLEAVRRSMTGNVCVLVDDAEKSGNGRQNGNLTSAMLPFLEASETGKRFFDPYVQCPCDLSQISYIVTVNDPLLLPKPLRDRLRHLHIPMPGPEALPALARTLAREILVERGVSADWAFDIDNFELDIASRIWRGGSIRRLRSIIEIIILKRDELALRH